MSAGIQARGLARNYEAGRKLIDQKNADNRRGAFLRKLDAGKVDLEGFELDFVSSFLGDRALKDAGLDFQWFTPKRRAVVDRMMHQHDVGSLTLPSSAPIFPRKEIVRADVGTCQYLMREDGAQRECGQPAAYKGRARPFLLYCQSCGEMVSRSFEVVALDGSGRVLKPFRTSNRREASSL